MKKIVVVICLALLAAYAPAAFGGAISSYPEATDVTGDDLLLITDNPGGIPTSKKTTVATLFSTAGYLWAGSYGTTGQLVRSSGTAVPAWSTATFADTYAKGTFLYAPTANTIQEFTHPGEAYYLIATNSADGVGYFKSSQDIIAFLSAANDAAARTELGAQTLHANLTAISGLTPTANCVIAYDGDVAIGCFETHRHDNSAAQFVDKTVATKAVLIDPAGVAETKTATLAFANTLDATYTFPVTSSPLVGAGVTTVTKYEYIPVRYGEADDSVQEPAAAAEINTTSTMIGRGHDKDTDEGLVYWWHVPGDYVSGIKYRVYYSPAVTVSGANMTAAFSMAGCSVGNSDAIACTEGDEVVVTDELAETTDAAGDLIISDWSAAVTVTNIAAGEMAKLRVIRDVSGDDYTDGDLNVVGVEIKYVGKINAFSDY